MFSNDSQVLKCTDIIERIVSQFKGGDFLFLSSFSGCSTEETLCSPKCNSSTLLPRTDAELHHSTGTNQRSVALSGWCHYDVVLSRSYLLSCFSQSKLSGFNKHLYVQVCKPTSLQAVSVSAAL